MNVPFDSSDQEYRATLRREKFKATAIWNDMVNHLRGNVVVKRRRWKMKSYEDCFQGSEAISSLQNYVKSHPDLRHTVSRAQLRNLCQFFMQKRILESVEDEKLTEFEDGSKLFRFVDVAYSNTGPQVQQDFRRLVLLGNIIGHLALSYVCFCKCFHIFCGCFKTSCCNTLWPNM